MVAEQRAYIRDYEVEIAAQAAAYDPIMGSIQYGLVLDVKPVISNDRKFITLELRPTVSRNVQFRVVDIRPGDAFLTNIQLPWIKLERAQCTVRLPDRGTVLIGGMKNILETKVEEGTPFLSKIPILGWLFKRRGRSFEQQNLIIVVTAEIIDLAEQEEKR
jgi:type II secretory pathway component GspD/PulD (secretin)